MEKTTQNRFRFTVKRDKYDGTPFRENKYNPDRRADAVREVPYDLIIGQNEAGEPEAKWCEIVDGSLAYGMAMPVGYEMTAAFQDWLEGCKPGDATPIEAAVLSQLQPAPVDLSDDQIATAWDSCIRPREGGLYDQPWNEVSNFGRPFFLAFARAILAHAPAAQPATPSVPLGLNETMRREVVEVSWGSFLGQKTCMETSKAMLNRAIDETLARLSPAPTVPVIHETAKCPPTAEDANDEGMVDAADHGGSQWYCVRWEQAAKEWKLWKRCEPVPPAPQRTAEDNALSQIDSRLNAKFQDGNISVRQIIAEVWKSRGEFEDAQKSSQP